jgi:hypothetical protein
MSDRVLVPCAPFVSTNGRSKIRSASSVRKIRATRRAGLSSGSVIFVNRCHAVAPSTFAAS